MCDSLRAAGHEVWFDKSDLRGGDAWDAAIRKQVKECALFMPVISANTEARSEGYFRREWNLAVNRIGFGGGPIVPAASVVIDDTAGTTACVPERFRERQWTRLAGGIAPAEFAKHVMRMLDDAVCPRPEPGEEDPPREGQEIHMEETEAG